MIQIISLQTFFYNIMAEKRVFRGATYGNYSIEEMQALAMMVNKCKKEYDSELERMKGKTHWNAKKKRLVPDTLK
uniref:Uncharacterized protein n=1 Tax=Octopus bimaculoides TaxID=37653 RepID=A0A0L8HKU5_OCTBM